MSTITSYSGQLTAFQPDLIAKGRKEGSELRPPSDAAHMDQHETEVHSAAQKHIANEHQLFNAALTETSRTAVDLHQKVLELEGKMEQLLADNSVQSAIAADMAEDRQALVTATETRIRAQADLQYFRARHSITDPAQYPESHWLHFGIILALALGETSINAFFYENAQGLLGGFIVALAVAGVNMFGALVLGMLFRYKNVVDVEKRIGGWACAFLYVLLTIYCNALFAAFRSEYQILADPTDSLQVRQAFRKASQSAAQVFLFNMDFGDLMSFILFGVGILLSGFAFYKGYTYDDRFPGHGDKDRAVKAAARAEVAKQEALREKVKGLLNARRQQIQNLLHEPAQLVSNAGTKAAALDHSRNICEAQQATVQRDLELMLRTYRESNTAVRSTTPPQYFTVIPSVTMPLPKAAIDATMSQLAAAAEAARGLRSRFQEPLNAKLNTLQANAATILNEEFAGFLKSVERDAEANINRKIPSIAGEKRPANA
jgi:hypothetical protein